MAMDDIRAIVAKQKAHFITGQTLPRAFRAEQLKRLADWMDAHEQDILSALSLDLGKSAFEAYLTEFAMVKQELSDARSHLRAWMKPKRARTAIGQIPGRCRILSEPYGVALIMSPWNYPFQLAVAPLIGAICAGNCAVVKPSAYAPATSALISGMLGECYPPEYVAVVEGGRAENTALLEQAFDYIFFTGSPAVGRLVMEKASAHLTPVSLELGGKSPVIVDESADIPLAARRLMWGKLINAGQTCVAPDYVLVHSRLEKALVEALTAECRRMFGDEPLLNDEYPKIVNRKHLDRLLSLLSSGTVALGGQADIQNRKLAPTILTDVDWASPVMSEEIFGPILPILRYESLDDALARIRERPKPLALYLFTQDRAVERRVLDSVSFGGGCVNDTIMHLATSHMPFGGVGESGMGRYHGRWSFETFSHQKSVLWRGARPDVPLRYAPYAGKLPLLKRLIR